MSEGGREGGWEGGRMEGREKREGGREGGREEGRMEVMTSIPPLHECPITTRTCAVPCTPLIFLAHPGSSEEEANFFFLCPLLISAVVLLFLLSETKSNIYTCMYIYCIFRYYKSK